MLLYPWLIQLCAIGCLFCAVLDFLTHHTALAVRLYVAVLDPDSLEAFKRPLRGFTWFLDKYLGEKVISFRSLIVVVFFSAVLNYVTIVPVATIAGEQFARNLQQTPDSNSVVTTIGFLTVSPLVLAFAFFDALSVCVTRALMKKSLRVDNLFRPLLLDCLLISVLTWVQVSLAAYLGLITSLFLVAVDKIGLNSAFELVRYVVGFETLVSTFVAPFRLYFTDEYGFNQNLFKYLYGYFLLLGASNTFCSIVYLVLLAFTALLRRAHRLLGYPVARFLESAEKVPKGFLSAMAGVLSAFILVLQN